MGAGLGAGLGIAGAGIGAVGGVQKFFEGRSQARQARQALNNYQRQSLDNSFSDVQVSRLGADIQREEQSRIASSQVDALRQGGTRTIAQGIGTIGAQQNQLQGQIAAGLDQQQQQINMAAAQDQSNIRGMQEQREMGELAGYGQQLDVANNAMMQGLGDVGNASMLGRQMAMGYDKPYSPERNLVSQETVRNYGGEQASPTSYQLPNLSTRNTNNAFNKYWGNGGNINPFRNQFNYKY